MPGRPKDRLLRATTAVAHGLCWRHVVAGALLSAMTWIAAGPAPAAVEEAEAGNQVWISRWAGLGDRRDRSVAVAVSPDGSRVFVTGATFIQEGDPFGSDPILSDFVTVAYDRVTGSQIWAATYSGGTYDVPSDISLSPDGRRVFVTGHSAGITSRDYATLAYDAETGAQLWASRYDAAGISRDVATSVAVSPDGTTVFVTGQTTLDSVADIPVVAPAYATVAYDASSGMQRWASQYRGLESTQGSQGAASSVAISPDGGRVFVTGGIEAGPDGYLDIVTVAYDSGTGLQQWVSRYDGPADAVDAALDLVVAPDGGRVFVTGYSYGADNTYDSATVAYDAVTGAEAWVARLRSGEVVDEFSQSLAVSPDGTRIFVTGHSDPIFDSGADFMTAAYDTDSGSEVWKRFYDGPARGIDFASSVAVAPDGATVIVTGSSLAAGFSTSDFATVAYDAFGGQTRWVNRYDGLTGEDTAAAVEVSPDGAHVFVTGSSAGPGSWLDYATVAYKL
jgi:WD40 repeat protein